jgi:hypothetical protein
MSRLLALRAAVSRAIFRRKQTIVAARAQKSARKMQTYK